MDIQTRKIQIMRDFLNVSSIELIEKFENLLKEQYRKMLEIEIKPMSLQEYESLFQKAVEDKKNGKVKNARNLKKEISTWK
ncbi:MAG TPA: hypothetical protein DEH02_17470 [Bacteroidales bacterium]|nr:MAG: hypothetical protein A2X01_20115 [Bacteroidetes bacterium GWF2_35_48]OFY95561.1 MAG: hypothetical protein A2491_13675 [Bacteroidetes bacterium RIFOXYC12_FULL_35_7]HBX52858.1 hypothetical protein [Bacteroidales bacterium]